MSGCSLSGEPDFRVGFRNWIKNQVPMILVKVYIGIHNGHYREVERVGETACLARVVVWAEK